MTRSAKRLLLILADQLSDQNPVLRDADPARDVLLLAEVREEASYVPHNRHKIVLIFSAMRHFAERWRARGFQVIYRTLAEGVPSLDQAVEEAVLFCGADAVAVTEPGEYRVLALLQGLEGRLGRSVALLDDTRFLASRQDFSTWAKGRKNLRMEYFYREMRRRYELLLTPSGDEAALTEAMAELLADEDRRRVMGAAAHEAYLERFTWDGMIESFRAIYHEMMG